MISLHYISKLVDFKVFPLRYSKESLHAVTILTFLFSSGLSLLLMCRSYVFFIECFERSYSQTVMPGALWAFVQTGHHIAGDNGPLRTPCVYVCVCAGGLGWFSIRNVPQVHLHVANVQ